ncbi:hypothetical protein QCA50_011863 [Cerrena zonata]|uniref:F-box domain-containing protein n=1 Tax=Cerrena zonata TaxID=2478898 RepID=A0AAW0FTS9_9APHY
MSNTLPSFQDVMEFINRNRHDPQPTSRRRGKSRYSDFSKILNGGTRCLGKRSVSPSSDNVRPDQVKRVRLYDSAADQRCMFTMPPEIHDYILQMFWDHKNIVCSSPETIQACALTSKGWWAIARRHIFRAITLESCDELEELTEVMGTVKDAICWMQRVRIIGSLPPYGQRQSKQLPSQLAQRDRWIYDFPAKIEARRKEALIHHTNLNSFYPYNVRILELFNVGHLSDVPNDCEWFGYWTSYLSLLEHVETFYSDSCEMSPNAMTAIIRSLPRVVNVSLADVNLELPNHVAIRDLTNPTLLNEKENIRAQRGLDFEEASQNGVHYTIWHPPPFLKNLSVIRKRLDGPSLDLLWIYGWFSPSRVSSSIISLDLSGRVELQSIFRLLAALGPAPTLQSFGMFAGCSESVLKICNFDISLLTGLRSLLLRGGKLDRLQTQAMCYILSLVNAPHLREFTIVMEFDKRLKSAPNLDEALTGKQFSNLSVFVLECLDVMSSDWPIISEKVSNMFPQMKDRGILTTRLSNRPHLF